MLFKQKNKNLAKATEKGIHTLPASHEKLLWDFQYKTQCSHF